MGYVRVGTALETEGQAAADRRTRISAGMNMISPEYFQTLGIPMVRGRSFVDTDHERSRSVAVINERLADMLWPGQDAVGRRFRSDGPWIEVVGMVPTSKYEFLFEEPQPYFYVPIAQQYSGLRVLQVRASLPPAALAPAVERAIRALAPHLPLYDVQTMTQALGSGLGFFPVRVASIAAAVFGLLAFVLAIIGLYGVTSYLTSQRTHEIGIRIAVGATERNIVRLVLGDGSRFVIAGMAAGIVMTLGCSRVVGRYLFGVSASDPLTLLGVAPILSAVALMACAVPAWRAARVDPTTALRSE
jgi:predicted permease